MLSIIGEIILHMKLSLHKCEVQHLDQLTWISRKTFIDAFEKQNNPHDFETYIKEAFNPEVIKKQLLATNSSFYYIENYGQWVGYLKLNENDAQSDVKDHTAMELERIYVLEKYQGKQIGKWMLEQAIHIARTMQKKYLWLGVWEQNIRAIEFYKRYGFQIFGTHPYFVGKDKQTDWLMRLELVP